MSERIAKMKPMRLTIELDAGLAAYMRALVASPVGIFGDEKETAVFAIRTFLIGKMESEGFREPIIDRLPPQLQRQWRKSSREAAE